MAVKTPLFNKLSRQEMISLPFVFPFSKYVVFQVIVVLQHCESGISDIGEVIVGFTKTGSSINMRINSAQSLNDDEQEQEDSLTLQDMMSFSWQIAQGMVGEESIVFFMINRSKCRNGEERYASVP